MYAGMQLVMTSCSNTFFTNEECDINVEMIQQVKMVHKENWAYNYLSDIPCGLDHGSGNICICCQVDCQQY